MIKFFKSMLSALTVCIFAFLTGINVAKAVDNITVITINSPANPSITAMQTIQSSTSEEELNIANVKLNIVQAENNGFSSNSMQVTVSALSSSDNQEQSSQTIIEENIDNRIVETLNKEAVKTTELKTSSNLDDKKNETISNEEDQTIKENDNDEILALDTLEPIIGASSTQKPAKRNWWIPAIIVFLVLAAAYYGYIALVGAQGKKNTELASSKKTSFTKEKPKKSFFKENQVVQKSSVNEVKKEEDTQEIKPIDEEDKTRW